MFRVTKQRPKDLSGLGLAGNPAKDADVASYTDDGHDTHGGIRKSNHGHVIKQWE